MNSVHYDCSYSLFRETAVPTIREGRNNATGNSAKPCVVKPRQVHMALYHLRDRSPSRGGIYLLSTGHQVIIGQPHDFDILNPLPARGKCQSSVVHFNLSAIPTLPK